MTRRMMLADLDGTVLSSDGQVSPQTAAALRRLHGADWRVVLATGRCWRSSRATAQTIGIGQPVICATGALVKHPDGRTLQAVTLPEPTFFGLAETLHGLGHSFFVHTDEADHRDDALLVPGPTVSAESRQYVERARWAGEMPPGESLESLSGRAIEISVWAPNDELVGCREAVHRAMGEAVRTVLIYAPNARMTVLEIFAAGVSKWAAAEDLARRWDIAADDIVAVGDDVNDLEMITEAGLGVAMGNAVDAVRSAADRITGTNDDGGLASLVDELLASA